VHASEVKIQPRPLVMVSYEHEGALMGDVLLTLGARSRVDVTHGPARVTSEGVPPAQKPVDHPESEADAGEVVHGGGTHDPAAVFCTAHMQSEGSANLQSVLGRHKRTERLQGALHTIDEVPERRLYELAFERRPLTESNRE
jgi:hypothetical protein